MKKLLLFAWLVLLLLVSCAEPTCAEQTVEYRESIDAITAEWDDALDIANSTARMNLAEPLGDLQAINRDSSRIEVPECASEAHEAMLLYQETTIDGFLAFMSQQEDSEVARLFDEADEHGLSWAVAYSQLTEEETEE